jgi:hypothetical protein
VAGSNSPERVAMTGFPEAHCCVVATRICGDAAFVLLDTGSAGHPYHYGVHCHRNDGVWKEGSSANGPGWSQSGPDPRLGTMVFWAGAPPNVRAVRVVFGGTALEEPIVEGVFLAVWWRVPCPKDDWPRVTAHVPPVAESTG